MVNKRQKFCRCKYSEHYYDDLTNVQLCNNSENDSRTCDCTSIIVQSHCPFFSPDEERSMILEIDKNDKDEIKEYEDRLMKKVREKIYSITQNSNFVNRVMNFLNRKREDDD